MFYFFNILLHRILFIIILSILGNQRVISQTNGVWICSLAMNLAYDCVHCVCHECHFKKLSSGERRPSRRSRTKSTINNQDPNDTVVRKCDHTSLEKFSDLSYFTKTFRKKIDDEGYCLPKKCSECNFLLVKKT